MMPEMQKLKIQTNKKRYPLRDCALYKLRSKRRLFSVLKSTQEEVKFLSSSEDNYICFEKDGRTIEQPKPRMDRVHTRIASLLCRIQPANNLHSGVKGRSNITNASEHLGSSNNLIATDIRAFYSSTKRSHVFDFFLNALECSPDVANILSKLSTFDDHVPTGSRLSMPIAYFANQNMFRAFERFAEQAGATITIYVDDLTFSGNSLSTSCIPELKHIAYKFGHNLHPKKTKFYEANSYKLVTGVALKGAELRAMNRHQRKMHLAIKHWESSGDETNIESTIGLLTYLGSVQPRWKDKARSLRNAVQADAT